MKEIVFQEGIIDGKDHPFNQETYTNYGNDYYKAFIEGYMLVEGNMRDTGESMKDA